MRRIIDHGWSISYGLRLITSIVDQNLRLTILIIDLDLCQSEPTVPSYTVSLASRRVSIFVEYVHDECQ